MDHNIPHHCLSHLLPSTNHSTSNPRYPQANGEAERAVQTIKRLLKRAKDPYLALLSYRSTPIKVGFSPAELLMGRSLRKTVPTTTEQLQPKLPDHRKVKERDRDLKIRQKNDYDKRHKTSEQSILEPGDEVWISNKNTSGEVEQTHGTRLYDIAGMSSSTACCA